MKEEKKLYTVKEVCERFHITRKTLFYYDKTDILNPSKRSGIQNHKKYSEEDLEKLNRIIQLRSAGLKIDEIRFIITSNDFKKILCCLKDAKIRAQKALERTQEEILNLDSLIVEYEKLESIVDTQ